MRRFRLFVTLASIGHPNLLATETEPSFLSGASFFLKSGLRFQLLLHGVLGQGLQKMSYITRPIVTLAIDKERRRPVYAASYAGLEILSNPECVNARSDFPNQSRLIEAEFARIGHKILVFKRALIFEKKIVHAPKLFLNAGCFCGLGCVLRVRVNIYQRKVAKGEK
jgi:hypothetical protein